MKRLRHPMFKVGAICMCCAWMWARILWVGNHPAPPIPPDISTTHLELGGVALSISLIIAPFYLLALIGEDL